jgi:lipoprotein-anchoring transpeptidase ErfK/SrfK
MPEIFSRIPRRTFLGGLVISGLTAGGCSKGSTFGSPTAQEISPKNGPFRSSPENPNYEQAYGAMPEEQFPLPAVDYKKLPRRLLRRRVEYQTNEPAGTVIVDTKNFYLYHVEDDGTAMRYGVGLGRAGFSWSGRARIAWKKEWPKWTPPDEMIGRQPELEKWSADNGGMPPGWENPLGARALYIFEGKRDTLYRLHGTTENFSIGKAVSSGCVRLINQDVINLYNQVKPGSMIVVT